MSDWVSLSWRLCSSDMLKTIIQENIANIMVLPNRIVVEMAKGVKVAKLKFPQPDVSLYGNW